jgi:hypothetical protein
MIWWNRTRASNFEAAMLTRIIDRDGITHHTTKTRGEKCWVVEASTSGKANSVLRRDSEEDAKHE